MHKLPAIKRLFELASSYLYLLTSVPECREVMTTQIKTEYVGSSLPVELWLLVTNDLPGLGDIISLCSVCRLLRHNSDLFLRPWLRANLSTGHTRTVILSELGFLQDKVESTCLHDKIMV
jgi:hypothetical protein